MVRKRAHPIDILFWFLEMLILLYALKILLNVDPWFDDFLNALPFFAIVFAAGIAYQKIQQNKSEIERIRDVKIPELEKRILEMHEQTRREIREVRDLVNQIIGKLEKKKK